MIRLFGALVALLALSGCGTTLSTLQPAEPMRPGHVQANAAMNVNVPASRVVAAVDEVATLGDRYASDPAYRPTDEEQQKALAAAVGLGLSAPGMNPDLMLRVGILDDLDVGARWSGLAAHVDGKYRFLATGRREVAAPDAPASDDDPGFQGAVSIGVSKALYSGFVFDVLDYMKMGDYSRYNLEVPVLFGARLGPLGHYWFGPKYVFSTYSLDASLANIGAVSSTSGTIHHLGAFGGAAIGYKVVFVFAELTAMYMFAKPEIFGRPTDLGGVVIVPAGGLMLRL